MSAGDAGLERQAMHEGMGPPYAVPREWLVQAERERDKFRAQLAAQQAVVDAARWSITGTRRAEHEQCGKSCIWRRLIDALAALDKAQAAQPEGEQAR